MLEYRSIFTAPRYSTNLDGVEVQIYSTNIEATEILNKVINKRVAKFGIVPERTDEEFRQPNSLAYPEKDLKNMTLQEIRNYVTYFVNCVESESYFDYKIAPINRSKNDMFITFIPFDDIKAIEKQMNNFFNEYMEEKYPSIIKIFNKRYLSGERYGGDIRYKLLSATGTDAECDAYSSLWYSIKLYGMCKFKWKISIDTMLDIVNETISAPYWDLCRTDEELFREYGFKSIPEMYQEEVDQRNKIIDLTFTNDIESAFYTFTKCMEKREENCQMLRRNLAERKENNGK